MLYETTFLVNPNITHDDLDYLLKQIKDTITRAGGEIVKDFSGKKIVLAYPIKKLKQAYLYSVDFELERDKINTIKNQLKDFKPILRHLIITKRIKKPVVLEPPKPKPKTKPKPKVKIEELDKKIEEILEE